MVEQFFFAAEGASDPIPSDLEIATAAKPMGIDASSLPRLDEVRALTDQVERGHGQDQAEPFQRRGGTDARSFQLKAIGFIVQEILFYIETQAVLLEGFQTGGFITDDDPALVAIERASHRQVEWTEARLGDLYLVPETGMACP